MNIGIDIDGTLTKYPAFFVELGLALRARGNKVYIITGLGHKSAVERLQRVVSEHHNADFYDELIDTSQYDMFERSLIGRIDNNELIVGLFKQRKCRELDIVVMFDDKAAIHRNCGASPIFEVV